MRRWARVCTAALALSLSARAAETGSVVAERIVRNVGPGRVDPQYVFARTTLRVGAELDRRAIARDTKALLATGAFSDVSIRAESATGGVRVVYEVRSRLRLDDEIEVIGNVLFSAGKIRKTLELKPGDPVDDRILGDRVRRVTEKYREQSYVDASASWELRTVNTNAGLAHVKLTMREGLRASVRKVVFEGNQAIPDSELRATLDPPPWWNVFRWFSRDRYERDNVELAQVRIRELYINRGYREVEVDPPAVQRNSEGRVAITYRIREGIKYHFGALSVRGNKLFPQAELVSGAKMRRGEPASQTAIDGTRQAIEDVYGARGYIDTAARPVLDVNRTNATVNVVFDVRESERVFIRNIQVRGNERTRDKVIRREILVQPGEVFDEVRVRRSERILQNLGFFETVRADALGTLNPGERDLVFDVAEKSTGQFHIGAGFSSIDKLIGFAELSQGNFDLFGWPYFTGAGQKLRLRTEYGDKRKDYSIDFTEPWFLDRKLALGLELSRTELDYTDYDVKRTGGGVSLGKALPHSSRVTLRYRLERSSISDVADTNRYVYVDPPQDDYYFAQEEDLTASSLRLSLSHDTRNRPFIPTSGNLSSIFGEVAGGVLGFDTDVYQLGLNCGQYVPLWMGHVLYVRGRCEVVEIYGDTDELPLSERLYCGGPRTVRGYEYRDVGPKVVPAVPTATSYTYRPAGGQTLAVAKADYTIPVVQGIRLAGFFDIGNVWRNAFDADFGTLASSCGVGVRLDVPGFPISVDYAWPVRRDDSFTSTDAWSFWIGYDF